MKKLILIATVLIGLGGCDRDTSITCPCIVVGIDEDLIIVKGVKESSRTSGIHTLRFTFHTQSSSYYQIGDTIK